MICSPCRKQDHPNCDNRITNIERDEIVLNGPEVTKTRCDCQHLPLETNPQFLTVRENSDTLEPEEAT